jgi:hypothetical protein
MLEGGEREREGNGAATSPRGHGRSFASTASPSDTVTELFPFYEGDGASTVTGGRHRPSIASTVTLGSLPQSVVATPPQAATAHSVAAQRSPDTRASVAAPLASGTSTPTLPGDAPRAGTSTVHEAHPTSAATATGPTAAARRSPPPSPTLKLFPPSLVGRLPGKADSPRAAVSWAVGVDDSSIASHGGAQEAGARSRTQQEEAASSLAATKQVVAAALSPLQQAVDELSRRQNEHESRISLSLEAVALRLDDLQSAQNRAITEIAQRQLEASALTARKIDSVLTWADALDAAVKSLDAEAAARRAAPPPSSSAGLVSSPPPAPAPRAGREAATLTSPLPSPAASAASPLPQSPDARLRLNARASQQQQQQQLAVLGAPSRDLALIRVSEDVIPTFERIGAALLVAVAAYAALHAEGILSFYSLVVSLGTPAVLVCGACAVLWSNARERPDVRQAVQSVTVKAQRALGRGRD